MIVFVVTFAVYLLTLFPGVAPYRDTGEMVSAAATLGIAHPPGYPLYTLLAKASIPLLAFGTAGYRLNVLSALAGAGTAWLLYRIFLVLGLRRITALCAALLFAFSYLQWYLSLVSEMYTLSTLFAAAVLYLLVRARAAEGGDRSRGKYMCAAAFLFGAGLGVRTELMLIGPGVAWLGYRTLREMRAPGRPVLRDFLFPVLFFAAGLTVFLYLPFRSSQVPFLDWNHPATLERLWGTLNRRTHGGTLDLVSVPYAAGANFLPTVSFYLRHLFTGFAFIGIPLALLGLLSLGRKNRDVAVATLLAWLCAGPLFIYLANMPPNPHALVILEAHFLLPNLIVALWVGAGIEAAGTLLARRESAAALLGTAMVAVNVAYHLPELNKRGNFVAYDYARNILRSLPPGSVAVMKKDVQLFALWNQQIVEKRRPDCAVVSQGLAGSPWYQEGMRYRHPDLKLMPLRSPDDWAALVRANGARPVAFSGDAEYFRFDGARESPAGLVTMLTPGGGDRVSETLLESIYPCRGDYSYPAYREFFTPDLIEDYAKAHLRLAQLLLKERDYVRVRRHCRTALSFQPLLPAACSTIAFSYFEEGKIAEARAAFDEARTHYETMLDLAGRYRSLPEVTAGIRRDLADTYLSLGVCAERTGKDEESLALYRKAGEAYPSARAHFNRAAVYWKRNDWRQVETELEKALALDPRYAEAAFYLREVRQKHPSK